MRLIVDEHGMPHNPQIVKSLDPGLDQKALDAVLQYRFRPAQKRGVAVPVMITIRINYQLR